MDANLSQLTAISDYKPAQEAVGAAQGGINLAAHGLSVAVAAQGAAEQVVREAQGGERLAEGKLTNLAILAYVGFGYGTLNEPADGVEAADGQVMLASVADQVRKGATAAKTVLLAAEKSEQQAADATGAARQKLSDARSELTLVRQTLALVVDAAQDSTVAAGVDFAALPGLVAAGAAPDKPAGRSKTTPPASETTATTAPTTTAPSGSNGPSSTQLVSATETLPSSPSILGPSVLDGAQLAQWFASTGQKANTTVGMTQLAADYETAGKATGVAYDVAFAQSVVETGWFSFPSYGQVTPQYNNFAGIGACDSCAHGWSFKTALQGVEAQMELLDAYASPEPVSTPLIGPVGVGGCCTSWITLAGTWATSLTYGISIMTVYNQMLAWIIPQRLSAAGLERHKSGAHA